MYGFVRYPFVITDDAGYAVLSCPSFSENKKCFFSCENFSSDELTFLFSRIRECKLRNTMLLKESKKGNAVFVSPFLFGGTRMLVALCSDIDYDIASSVCAFSRSDVAVSTAADKKLGKKHEKAYKSICDILYSLKNATDAYLYEDDFYKYLGNMVEAVSHMTFCKANVNFEPQYVTECPDNFDAGILSLYLFIMMSAASFASDKRCAEIDISIESDVLFVPVRFSAPMDKKALADFEEKFSYAVSVLDGICAENNLPMYFYRDGVMRSGIIPCRIENGIIGLKARVGYLKDEQEKEQKERNIFLATLS